MPDRAVGWNWAGSRTMLAVTASQSSSIAADRSERTQPNGFDLHVVSFLLTVHLLASPSSQGQTSLMQVPQHIFRLTDQATTRACTADRSIGSP